MIWNWDESGPKGLLSTIHQVSISATEAHRQDTFAKPLSKIQWRFGLLMMPHKILSCHHAAMVIYPLYNVPGNWNFLAVDGQLSGSFRPADSNGTSFSSTRKNSELERAQKKRLVPSLPSTNFFFVVLQLEEIQAISTRKFGHKIYVLPACSSNVCVFDHAAFLFWTGSKGKILFDVALS